jgi:hypothetical protein
MTKHFNLDIGLQSLNVRRFSNNELPLYSTSRNAGLFWPSINEGAAYFLLFRAFKRLCTLKTNSGWDLEESWINF